jgi:hypothetical protein
MERGIGEIATALAVPPGDLDGKMWKQIFDLLMPKINALPKATPDERAAKEFFQAVLAHLGAVKDAWRNPTMHARYRFNQEEAEGIFRLFRQMRVVFLKRWTCFPFMELQQHTP